MTDTVEQIEPEDVQRPHPQRRGIWWLASYPKSGNTWARMVLNSAVTGFPPNINAGYQYVVGDNVHSLLQQASSVPVAQMAVQDFLCYRLAALRNLLELFPSRDACLKTHNANVQFCDVPLIPAWMTKGAVYVVRDPRDVAISFAKHVGRGLDEAIAVMGSEGACLFSDGHVSGHVICSWSMHVTSWLDEDCPFHPGVIRYEDMHDDPLAAFRKLLDCLGLEFIDSDRLVWAIEQCRIDNLRQQEARRGFRERSKKTDKFFGAGRHGGWRDVLTCQQVEQIESDHHEVMEQLGYELVSSCVGV